MQFVFLLSLHLFCLNINCRTSVNFFHKAEQKYHPIQILSQTDKELIAQNQPAQIKSSQQSEEIGDSSRKEIHDKESDEISEKLLETKIQVPHGAHFRLEICLAHAYDEVQVAICYSLFWQEFEET